MGTTSTSEPRASSRLVSAVVVPADQAVYALTNLVPLIPLSRSLDQVEFGEVALAQSLVVGLAVLGRAYFATPLLAVADSVGVRSPTTTALTRLSVMVAAFGALGVLVLAAVPALPLPGLTVMAALCVGLPAVFPIEIKRLSFIRADQPMLALATDGTWLVAELAVLLLLSLAGVSLRTTALLCWSLGAFTALLVAFTLARRSGATREAGDPSLTRLGDLGRGFLTEAVLLVARVQGYFLTLAVVSGAAALGGVRFAFALVAPANTALAGWRTFATGQFREQNRHTLSPLIIGPPAVVAIGLVAIAAFVPDNLVDSISGNVDAEPYLLPVATAVALSAVDIVVQAFLAAREQTDRLWMVRVVEVAAWLGLLLILQPSTSTSIARLMLIAAAIGTTAWIVVYGLTRRKDNR